MGFRIFGCLTGKAQADEAAMDAAESSLFGLVLQLDLTLEPLGSGFRVQGSGFRVQGSGFRVQGLGFRG